MDFLNKRIKEVDFDLKNYPSLQKICPQEVKNYLLKLQKRFSENKFRVVKKMAISLLRAECLENMNKERKAIENILIQAIEREENSKHSSRKASFHLKKYKTHISVERYQNTDGIPTGNIAGESDNPTRAVSF